MVEDYAYILDYLPSGRPDQPGRKEPVAYGIGEKNFVLLELVPKAGASLLVGDRVYLGRDPEVKKESPVERVRGRVGYDDITHAAQSEMHFIIEKMVLEQGDRFIKFYNEAGPVTTRMHMLELLPGLGKKLMWAIVEERKKGQFASFEEMEERVKPLHQPEKLIAHRIEDEIRNAQEKYHLFVQPAAPEYERGGHRGPPRHGGHGGGHRGGHR